MKLATVHQLVITLAGVLAVGLAGRGAFLFAKGGGIQELALAACASLLAVSAGVYLRRFRARLRG
ncbi:MAG: hypothetical protein EXR75_13740 [Myxococcales bacterium]|nr:hypothetical protein [Myxococcales bacterium]